MAKSKKKEAVVEAADGEETLEGLAAIGADVNGEESVVPTEAPETIGGSSVSEPVPMLQTDPTPPTVTGVGDHVIVEHAGQEHEAVCTGFTMGMRARLKDGRDTIVFVAHGDWRPRDE